MGDEIIIICKQDLPNMVCFKDFAHKILRQNWKTQFTNQYAEKKQILKKKLFFIGANSLRF